MEEFEKIDWIPNVEDIVDDKFVDEERLQNEAAMYKILNGIFQDPFRDIRLPVFKLKQDTPKQTQPDISNMQNTHVKKQKGRPARKKKKNK